MEEVILIARLRSIDFGVVEVHKADNILIRTIRKENERILEYQLEESLKQIGGEQNG
jgi:hypothetical protein